MQAKSGFARVLLFRASGFFPEHHYRYALSVGDCMSISSPAKRICANGL
jgi:hypothetical protein